MGVFQRGAILHSGLVVRSLLLDDRAKADFRIFE